jgi:hypothetical protein
MLKTSTLEALPCASASATPPLELGDVLEDLTGNHHVCHLVAKREGPNISLYGQDAVASGDGKGRGIDVQSDIDIARNVSAHQPPPQPRSSRTAPGRKACGIKLERTAANQCSAANSPLGRHHSSTRSSYWAGSLRARLGLEAGTPGPVRLVA